MSHPPQLETQQRSHVSGFTQSKRMETRQIVVFWLFETCRGRDFLRRIRGCAPASLKRMPPPPALFDKRYEISILKNLHRFPDGLRNRQRQKRSHVPPQSFLLRHQFVFERFIHAADMGNDHAHEKFLCRRDRLLGHVRRRLNDAGQFRGTEEFLPDLAVIRGDGQQIGDPPCLGFGTERDSREPQAADDANGTKKVEPVL